MRKYESPNHKFNEWVDLPVADLVDIVKKDSAGLERSDLKAIILELAQRLTDVNTLHEMMQ